MIRRLQSIWGWVERLRSRRLVPAGISFNGQIRRYLLYVPRHRLGGEPLPLVLMFHGGASHPRGIARVSGMHYIAEREGFIVVYPAGIPGRWGLTWNPGGSNINAQGEDIGFARALVDELRRRYDIDPRRVYAAGMSVGGVLVYRLACTMSNRFAAIAVVAGTMATENCRPSLPVSVLHIHGTADQRVPLRGGRGRLTARHNNWPPVTDGITRWCEINRCSQPGQVIRLIDGLVGHRYTGDGDVELWLVEGGRHVWPGSPARAWWWWKRPPAGGFCASEKVWQFFAEHARA